MLNMSLEDVVLESIGYGSMAYRINSHTIHERVDTLFEMLINLSHESSDSSLSINPSCLPLKYQNEFIQLFGEKNISRSEFSRLLSNLTLVSAAQCHSIKVKCVLNKFFELQNNTFLLF
jgi:hypothetical protein